MGKYGLKSGYGQFQNIQAGTDTFGGTSSTISLSESMKNSASVVVSPFQDSRVWVSGRATNEFEVSKTGNAKEVTISWIAFDDSESF